MSFHETATNDGIVLDNAPQPTEITFPESSEEELEETFGLNEVPVKKAKNAYGLPAFGGSSISRALKDSVENQASNAMDKGIVLMDKFHEYEADTYAQWKFAIMDRKGDDPEVLRQLREEVYERLFESWAIKTEMLGLPVVEEAKDEPNMLRDMAEWAAERKLVYEPFRGAWCERYVKQAIEEAYDVTVILHSEEIEKHGFSNPESSGIDAYIPEEDTTLQIKEGSGGKTDDESDLIARYHHESTVKVTVEDN